MNKLVLATCLTSLLAVPALSVTALQITPSGNKITAPGQSIDFSLSDAGQEAAVTHIFNLQGGDFGELTAKSLNRYSWDGTDTDRQPVESGVYVVQIRHHGQVWHGPILVSR